MKLDQEWDLSPVWARKKIAADLTAHYVGYEDFSHSRMLKVAFQGSDSRLAADIPNAIAKAYRIRKTTLWRTELDNSLDALQRELKDQSDNAEEARLRMLDLAERYHIVPEEAKLANFAVQEKVAAVVRTEIAIAKAFGKPEFKILQLQLELERVEITAKETALTIQRKRAEYDEAVDEYTLHISNP
ncbi:hypothetical protein N9260_02480 [bacterium]|nr:hypothetical protein [bacterium]